MVSLRNFPMPTAVAQSGSASLPKVEITFGSGKGQALKNFTLTAVELRTAVNEIPSGRVRFSSVPDMHDDYASLSKDLEICRNGAPVTVRIQGKVLFEGVVVVLGFEVRRGVKELTVRIKHTLQRLVSTHRSQVFAKQSDRQIIEHLFGTHKIPVKINQGLDVHHEQMVQCACSDWDFVRARLAASGVWLLPVGREVTIALPKLASRTHHTLSATQVIQDMLIEEATWTFTSLAQPKNIYVASWDIAQQKMSPPKQGKAVSLGSGALDAAKLPALDSSTWALSHSVPLESAEQAALVNGKILAQHAVGIQGRFIVNGHSNVALGETLELKGFGGGLDGMGIITGVEHRFSANEREWRTTLSLGLDTVREVDAPMVPKACGVYAGVVDSFEQDSKTHWNRIRVRVPALGLNGSLWARLTSPYASKDSGFCFYPEPGDEVVLGFFEDDPRYPVILGATHNPKKPAPFVPSQDNPRKGVVLVHGEQKQEWIFDRKEHAVTVNLGEERLVLHKGVQMQSDEGDVTVSTKKNLVLKATEKITLEADTEWSAKGRKSVRLKSEAGEFTLSPEKAQLKASEIDVQGAANVKLGSGAGKFELSSVQGKMSAPNVEVEGTVGVKVKGLKIDLGP